MRVLAIVGLLLCTMATVAMAEDLFAPVARDLNDPDAVFEIMREKGAAELPTEALAYYEAGIQASQEGNREEAIRNFMLASELDMAFPEAHLALAQQHFPGKPEAMLGDLGQAVRATAASFGAQHLLLVNLVFGTLILMVAALFLYLLYVAVQLLPRLHHSISEHLRRWFPPLLASLFALAILATPALWRIGMIPFVLTLAGLMWPWMRTGEKGVTATLAGITLVTPFLLWGLSPLLYSPLDPAERPFLLSRAMASPYTEGMVEGLQSAQERYPDDPSLYFSLALVEKRGGHFRNAEGLYKKALELGAKPAAVHNNLGVISFLRGNYDLALTRLQEAVEHDDEMASAHFNLSQTYAKKLYFEKADQELLKANRLSFNRIRSTLRHSEGDDKRTMIDEPLSPSVFWQTAQASPRTMPGLPQWLGPTFPGSLWILPAIVAVVFAGGLVVGRRLYRHLPTFACTNCRRPVCRRCLRRIRLQPYCASCGDALLRIQSSSYSRLVLDSRIRRNRRLFSIIARVGAWLFPGLHAVGAGRTWLGLFLTLGTILGTLGLVHRALPVTRLVWIENSPGPWWPMLPVVLLAIVVVISGITVIRIHPVTESRHKEEGVDRDESDHLAEPGRAA